MALRKKTEDLRDGEWMSWCAVEVGWGSKRSRS